MDKPKKWYEQVEPPRDVTDESGRKIRPAGITHNAFWVNKNTNEVILKRLSEVMPALRKRASQTPHKGKIF